MADSIKERMATGWQKIKLEGGVRLTRIRDLYGDASREAMTQLQTGSQEIRQIAQDSFTAITTDQPSEPPTQPALPAATTSAPASQLATGLKVAYAVAKEGWHGVSNWYQQARLQAATEPQTPNPLEQKQAAWETQAGELGTQAARKEQEIRQRVKQFLQTTTERL